MKKQIKNFIKNSFRVNPTVAYSGKSKTFYVKGWVANEACENQVRNQFTGFLFVFTPYA